MKKPVFVLLKKHFHLSNGEHIPFTTASSDIEIFNSFEEAKKSAMTWAMSQGKNLHVLCDYGELQPSAVQCDNLVFCVSVSCCFSRLYVNLGVDIYQKYVL